MEEELQKVSVLKYYKCTSTESKHSDVLQIKIGLFSDMKATSSNGIKNSTSHNILCILKRVHVRVCELTG